MRTYTWLHVVDTTVTRHSIQERPGFSSAKIANDLQEKCPRLWRLFQLLLNAKAVQRVAKSVAKRGDYLTTVSFAHTSNYKDLEESGINEASESNSDEELTGGADPDDADILLVDESGPGRTTGKKARRRQRQLAMVVSVILI